MKRNITFYLLLIATALNAYYSDPFPYGTYSYLQNGTQFYREHRKDILKDLQKLGYNITIIETNNSDKNLDELLADMDTYQVDAILTDKAWSNSFSDAKHYSVVALATSNYHRFEAEFENEKEVKPGDGAIHKYWYGNSGTIPRVGTVVEDKAASYQRAWQLAPERDKSGWAYTDIVFRWPDRHGNRLKLKDEIRFHKTHKDLSTDTDSLYLTYRIKLDNVTQGLRDDTPLFSTRIFGYLGLEKEYKEKADVVHYYGKRSGTEINFTYRDYLALGSPKGYFDLPIRISYNDYRNSKLFTDDFDNNPDTSPHWWWYVLRHFGPGLYWHGNCELSLDYIDMEDQIYRELQQNASDYKAGINARLRSHKALAHGKLIRYTYSMDEPFMTQLNSFNMIQGMIAEDNPPLLAASYDIKHRDFKMSGDDNWWDFEAMTRDIAQPNYIMPDIYPIKPRLGYDPADGEQFLQFVLDNRLGKAYRESKQYAMEVPGRKFYPIVQTFGFWNAERWLSWTLPPKATQKALLFLPLCYGPDGIYHYQLQGAVNSKGAGYYAPLIAIDNKEVKQVPLTYDVVEEINPRVKAMGTELLNWQWQNAITIMPDKYYPKMDLSTMNIAWMQTQVAKDGAYTGYMESGFYQKASGEKALFVVNRRTDEFLKTDKRKHPDFTSPDCYNEAYREYQPQTLELSFTKNSGHLALLDWEQNKLINSNENTLRLTLPAGEAKLLLVVYSIPQTLNKKKKLNLSGKIYIDGTVTLKKGSALLADSESEVILLPGAKLIIEKKAKADFKGKLTVMENAKIQNKGKLSIPE